MKRRVSAGSRQPARLNCEDPPFTGGMGVSVKAPQYLASAPKEHRDNYLVFGGLPFLDPESELFQTWAEPSHHRVAVLARRCTRVDGLARTFKSATIRSPNCGGQPAPQ
jgi:hypothetical protein